MPRKPAHTHTCRRCGIAFDCGGELEDNHDGVPEVICVAFHADGETECIGCRTTSWCVSCGEQPAVDVWDGDALCLTWCAARGVVMTPTDEQITEAMICYGGSFVATLGTLYRRGDPVNQARLRDAFPDFWQEYAELVQLRSAREKSA